MKAALVLLVLAVAPARIRLGLAGLTCTPTVAGLVAAAEVAVTAAALVPAVRVLRRSWPRLRPAWICGGAL